MRFRPLALALALLGGCSSAGPYGYSRTYSALDAEEDAADGAREYDPVMAERDKAEWKKAKISVFGVVNKRAEGPGGTAYVTLSVRTLEARNLCEQMEEESCRVTVGQNEFAVVHALLKLAPKDDLGDKSLNRGSLVRVLGKLTDEVDPEDGTPVFKAEYYRHWPRNFFVTTASRPDMPM
ncbi:MAG: hypothetical protein EOO73_05190 [Myxococcales bacterium]|nr:MAG: hypothetical protein EOO73_05190 [Myxococcales bacterium]